MHNFMLIFVSHRREFLSKFHWKWNLFQGLEALLA